MRSCMVYSSLGSVSTGCAEAPFFFVVRFLRGGEQQGKNMRVRARPPAAPRSFAGLAARPPQHRQSVRQGRRAPSQLAASGHSACGGHPQSWLRGRKQVVSEGAGADTAGLRQWLAGREEKKKEGEKAAARRPAPRRTSWLRVRAGATREPLSTPTDFLIVDERGPAMDIPFGSLSDDESDLKRQRLVSDPDADLFLLQWDEDAFGALLDPSRCVVALLLLSVGAWCGWPAIFDIRARSSVPEPIIEPPSRQPSSTAVERRPLHEPQERAGERERSGSACVAHSSPEQLAALLSAVERLETTVAHVADNLRAVGRQAACPLARAHFCWPRPRAAPCSRSHLIRLRRYALPWSRSPASLAKWIVSKR